MKRKGKVLPVLPTEFSPSDTQPLLVGMAQLPPIAFEVLQSPRFIGFHFIAPLSACGFFSWCP